jgi:hypothetical protein
MLKNRFASLAVVVGLSVAIVACQNEGTAPGESDKPALRRAANSPNGGAAHMLASINGRLEEAGADIRVGMVEWITDAESGKLGQTEFFKDVGNKQLDFDFVPADPRRGSRVNVTYVVDLADGTATPGLSPGTTEAAIDRAMATWDGARCSDISMTKNASLPFDVGVIQAILGFGGIPAFIPFADVIHAGWLPRGFFDLLTPGGGDFILGATFTVFFIDAAGNLTDIDNNGTADAAYREIYYNNNIPWAIDGDFDVETIALHEAGHGLSQGHFGKAFSTDKNGKIHIAPRALMNATYSGIQQTVTRSDLGGHCSNWAQWPNN